MEFFINDNMDSLDKYIGITLLKYVVEHIPGQYTIRYGKLCSLIGNIVGPRQIGQNLGAISDCCLDNGLPPISAVVINDDGIPGQGFFDYFYPYVGYSDVEKVKVLNEIYPEISSHKKEWIELLREFENN